MSLDESQWISQSTAELVLRGGGYCLSLEGYPSTSAAKTVRVMIPRSNLFSVNAVLGLMASLRERKGR